MEMIVCVLRVAVSLNVSASFVSAVSGCEADEVAESVSDCEGNAHSTPIVSLGG